MLSTAAKLRDATEFSAFLIRSLTVRQIVISFAKTVRVDSFHDIQTSRTSDDTHPAASDFLDDTVMQDGLTDELGRGCAHWWKW